MDVAWQGRHFRVMHEVVEIEPGKKRTFEFVWRLDGTRTLAVDDQNNILLTREYRHELQDYDWRLPGGKLDFEGENITEAAKRELLEETGVAALNWEYLWSTTPDATVRFKRHFLLATNVKIGHQRLSEGEKIEVTWLPIMQAKNMALNGTIREEISALSILRFISRQGIHEQ